jgi:cell division protein FtsL
LCDQPTLAVAIAAALLISVIASLVGLARIAITIGIILLAILLVLLAIGLLVPILLLAGVILAAGSIVIVVVRHRRLLFSCPSVGARIKQAASARRSLRCDQASEKSSGRTLYFQYIAEKSATLAFPAP